MVFDVNIEKNINVKNRTSAVNVDTASAVQYHYGGFPPSTLQYESFVQQLVAAAGAVARYDQMLKGMHNSEILLAPMRKQEAVISSRMEGTVSTMDEILRYEAEHGETNTSSPYVRSDVIETLLYQRSMRNAHHAMDRGYPLSLSLVKTIHLQLLTFGRGAKKSPGELKKAQNYLADKNERTIRFVPIRPEQLQDGLDRLFEYIDTSEHPALVRAALAHIEFEALHPFEDGNGRVGRMLITLMMWSAGLISAPHFYVSSFFEEHKDLYIENMRDVSKNGSWEKWCAFFLEAVEQQAEQNLQIAEAIQSLYEAMKIRFADLLSSKWSVTALDFVFTNPIFRNNKFTHSSGIPAATAARFTRLLLDEGLIETVEEASGRRPAMYSFEPLMKLVRV